MAEKTSRKQVRYERNDINAVFKKKPVFFNQMQQVKIINVSKQGIAICSSQTLKRNNHLKFLLSFIKGESFFLEGQVVHAFNRQSDFQYDEFIELFIGGLESPVPLPFKYGVHFEQHYPRFRDYLIESGCKNGFEVQHSDKLRMRRGDYQR
ncbi:MAG: PilZ domain-containing protein [Methylococcaceae bacterium]